MRAAPQRLKQTIQRRCIVENNKLPSDMPDDHGQWDDDTGGAGFYIGVAVWLWLCLLVVTAAMMVIG
jgi:hypothetical protein